jgi:beta-glucosidase
VQISIKMSFPTGFHWGVATSSYQIEGAVAEEGKGPSVWDVFCHKEGMIWQGHTGDVACDHYHRFCEDVALMGQIGVQAYRLSVCWPRVLPDGVGRVNAPGLAFYDRLVDALLQEGITPYVTLFHWDYPFALYRRGGWLNRDSADWFAQYVEVVVRALSDRVRQWVTLNEVQVFIVAGHQGGWHAPGDGLPLKDVLLAGHHALLAHGRAVQAIRANARTPAQVGYAPVGVVKIPASDRAEDIEAARVGMFSIRERRAWNNSWWMDPVLHGRYPLDGLELYGADAPRPASGDLATISERIDFFGVNIYQGSQVRAGPDGQPQQLPWGPGHPITGSDWPVTPEALYWGSRFLYERYSLPIVITENGLSCRDWVSLDGKVHDPQRIDFVTRYLRQLYRVIEDGVPVRGYFYWSLLDNFEWADGYKQRFGLVHVDFSTQQRTLKDSAHWYRALIASNGRSALP